MDEKRKRLFSNLLEGLVPGEGRFPSALKGVEFMKAASSYPRAPVCYNPGIVIVGQGRKIGYLGGEVYTYDPYNYLVLSVPLPFECETQATPEEPLLALSVGVDTTVLGELLLEMDAASPSAGPAPRRGIPRGMYSTPLTSELLDAGIRLLQCLKCPMESQVLGPQVMREIVFRVLQGPRGGALRALAAHNGAFSQISKALRRIHLDYAEPLDVETMAREVGMSLSAFHHNFKAVTSSSPLNYLKTIRLHKARMLMLQEGQSASSAAGEVGYASPSQFSREFKRFFGNSPVREIKKLREMG